jgi:hypothetical protein
MITKTILTFTPAEALEEKESEAGGNNTEQWNRNQKDVLAFSKAYLERDGWYINANG